MQTHHVHLPKLRCLLSHAAGGVGLLCPGSPAVRGGSVLDYIPRGEHLRQLEGRLAAKEADLQLELGSRVAQASGSVLWVDSGLRAVTTARQLRMLCAQQDLRYLRQQGGFAGTIYV